MTTEKPKTQSTAAVTKTAQAASAASNQTAANDTGSSAKTTASPAASQQAKTVKKASAKKSTAAKPAAGRKATAARQRIGSAKKATAGAAQSTRSIAQKSAANTNAAIQSGVAEASQQAQAMLRQVSDIAKKSSEQLSHIASYGFQSGEAVQQWMDSASGEMQKAQEKMMAISREGADQWNRQSSQANEAATEVTQLQQDAFGVVVECGNIASDATQEMTQEVVHFINERISEQLSLSKEFLGCRTVNQYFDLNSRWARTQLDSFFNESLRLSDLFFKYSQDITEPVSQHTQSTVSRMNRKFAA